MAGTGSGLGGADRGSASFPESASVAPTAWPANRFATAGMPFTSDYEELRKQRMAEISDELREIYESRASSTTRRDRWTTTRARPAVPPATVLDPGVEAFNIDIPGPAGPIPARVYKPKSADGQIGVYLHTHNSLVGNNGLTNHDSANSQRVLDWGCALVHPDFRIAPEHRFPAPIEDCYAAYQYVVDHAESLGFDQHRIGIGGGCTGATVATVVSLLARDAGGVQPAVQWLMSPTFDARLDYESCYECAEGYGLDLEDGECTYAHYLRSRNDYYDWRASPILAPTMKGMPPAIIWTGEWEILRDETRAYANRLRDAEVTVHYFEGPQQGHGYCTVVRNVRTGAPTEYQRQTVPQLNALMRRYIGPDAK